MRRVLVTTFSFVLLLMHFVYSVNADSTITIPVPEKAAMNKQVVLSLRIPPNTDPVTQKDAKPKMESRRSLIMWNSNPTPKIPPSDEFYAVTRKFMDKGWVKGGAAKGILNMSGGVDKYHGVRVLQHIVDNVLEIGLSPNVTRTVRKSNLVASDIEDLRRMVAKFSKELTMYGENIKRVDKDLLMLQDRYKTAKSGILKVIKVEGVDDGGTVIHLAVD